MKRTTKMGVAAGGAAALAAATLATAITVTSASADETTPTPSSTTAPERPGGMTETPLTGSDAEKATAAALAAVEGGTVLRVETDANDGGTYEAHVRKADGTEVVVTMDENFEVVDVKEFAGRGGRGGRGDGDGDGDGHGGHGHGGGGMGETPLTGSDAEKATAAALAAVEDGTVLRVETDANDGGTYEAHVRKADGTEVVVTMDENFEVVDVKEFAGRGDRHDSDDSDSDSGSSSSAASTASFTVSA